MGCMYRCMCECVNVLLQTTVNISRYIYLFMYANEYLYVFNAPKTLENNINFAA